MNNDLVDILKEDRLTLEEARSVLGTQQKPCNFATVWRAIKTGTLLPDDSRCYLEAVKVGGRWVTSREAIGRYVEATTAAWLKREPTAPVRALSKTRLAEQARVDRALERMGIARNHR
jgi:hypothetical protein